MGVQIFHRQVQIFQLPPEILVLAVQILISKYLSQRKLFRGVQMFRDSAPLPQWPGLFHGTEQNGTRV